MPRPDTPAPTELQTERLHLRAAIVANARALNQAVRDAWPALHEWMSWAASPTPQTMAETERVLRDMEADRNAGTQLPFLVWRRDDQKLVGACGVHEIDWDVPKFEIGYWLDPKEHGKGYATEAALALCQSLTDSFGAKRLEIMCDAENHRSADVARRAGFHLEARLHHYRRSARTQGLRDILLFTRFPGEATDERDS